MINVRFATRDDVATVAQLCAQMEHHYFGDDAPNETRVDSYVEQNFFQPHCGVQIALAYVKDKAVGIATFSILYPAPETSGQLFMKDLFTTNEARGQGVGKALMKFLARYAVEKGCKRFDWTAETTNPEALAYYDHLGAERIEEKVYFRLAKADLIAFADAI